MPAPGGNEPSTSGTNTTTSNYRQLSDGNPIGTVLGNGPNDKIGFFYPSQANPQPAGAQLNAVTRGVAAGVVMTFASVQSPSSVATLTSAEKSFTVQNGTGGVLTPKSTDFFVVNKPTAQAGIGVGNVRYSAAGVVGVTFTNFTAGTLTPTPAEIYGVVGVRGLNTVTTVLTPAAVAASTTAEQIFTVSGIHTNAVVGVNKPTAQAGLDIAGVRIPGNDQIAVTFVNVTAGVLTPTAAETYTFFASAGIDAANNVVMVPVNATLTPAVVATITTADVTITSANVLVDDTLVGIQKPTLQAGLGIVASRVSAASTLKVTFVNPTAGTLTPTASEIYVASLFREAPSAPMIMYQPVLTPASVAPNTAAEQTFTVTGVVSGTPVMVSKPSPQPGLGIMGARVSTTNVVAITFVNATANTITPTAGETYTIGNFQGGLIDTTSGNAFIQGGVPTMSSLARLSNALQAALGNPAAGGLNLVLPG